MLLAAGMLEVPTLDAAPAAPAADTTRNGPPLHFRRTTFFDAKYLTRAAEAALEKSRASEKAEATDDDPQKKAAAYARRYGIARDLAQKILDVAQAEGVDPELGFRLIRVESRFDPEARGAGGAAGLTQLMPSTARSVDRKVDTRKELYDPGTNLRIGFRYLRQMIERYDGDVRLGVLAYNRGEVAVDRALKRGRDPENGYSRKVLGTSGKNPYQGKGLLKKQSTKGK